MSLGATGNNDGKNGVTRLCHPFSQVVQCVCISQIFFSLSQCQSGGYVLVSLSVKCLCKSRHQSSYVSVSLSVKYLCKSRHQLCVSQPFSQVFMCELVSVKLCVSQPFSQV